MMQPPLQRLLDEASIRLGEYAEFGCREPAQTCESPIEVIMLQALAIYSLVTHQQWPKVNERPGLGWQIRTQHQIGNYRVDFLLETELIEQKIVIECDGHDFHERTKEQARRDRQRDRDLTSAGYIVLRFTGSEIWRDPWACAAEVEDQIISAWTRGLDL